MKWTQEKPTEEGYYCLRANDTVEPKSVQVRVVGGILRIFDQGLETGTVESLWEGYWWLRVPFFNDGRMWNDKTEP